MSVKLRFKRLGRRNRPFYRLVAIDSRSRRDGREIEKLGWYDPIKSDVSLEFDEDRLVHWLDQGAIPSDTLKTLLKKKGFNHKYHLMKLGLSEEKISKEMEEWLEREVERENKKEEKKKLKKKQAAELKAEEAAAEEAPAEEAAAEEAPAEEAAAEEVPAEEAAAEEVPAEEAAAEEAPAEEAAAEEAPTEEKDTDKDKK